ncbi:S24/S26 family peptidase [uncultured Bacteroides sp.]|uniref:S24/S26 family peptidase n=1 Tax=uncultured Bacteroides sp. TaxID=162156 RepID=UPI002606D53E|nr:S24/S26 family peptidase [uncultured Bacteroides sp.]
MANSNHKKLIPNEVLLPEVARLISEEHTVTLTVRGNSMNPFLVDRRDSIVLGSFAEADLQPGIAVLARESTGRIVFHRIISRRGSVLTLQGDGNLRATEQADTADVMGIMLSAIRKDKEYPCSGRTWQRYSYWWMKLTPVRRWLLAVFRRI